MPKPTDPVTVTTPPESALTGAPTSPNGGALSQTAQFSTQPATHHTAVPFGTAAAPGEVGTLGPYRIVKELGRGGMGSVFLALDSRLQRKLALKVMLPESAAHSDAKERFLREARVTATVEHDNVVTIYEADEYNGVPFIAMQLLQGCSLDDYLKKFGNLSIPQVLRIGSEIAAGLAAAHARGLVHRDIKPANLWLEAPNGRVKVLDFGLARPVAADGELTRSGLVIGTPAFMSPEQGQGMKVDHRTDIFSLGVVLYRLCTGKNPFNGPSVMAILMALGNKDPIPVRELNPDVPEPLAKLIHQLLAKNPDERPQTCDEVSQWIRGFAAHLAGGGVATNQPQVIYIPIPVAAQQDNSAFENLVVTDVDSHEGATLADSQTAVRKPAGKGMLVIAGLALLAAAGIAGIIAISMNRDSKALVEETVDPTAGGKKDKPKPPPDPLANDPERKAAEYAISQGGAVKVNGEEAEIIAVSNLPKTRFTLTAVILGGNKFVTDDTLAKFKDCSGLLELRVPVTSVTDRGMAHFKNCKKLTYLDVGTTQVSNTGLGYFKDCPDLKYLYLSFTSIDNAGLAMFDGRKNIERLHVTSTSFDNVGLAYFKECKNLTELHLQSTSITDEGLELFNGTVLLKSLSLSDTWATDKGLLYFAGCKNLENLTVDSTEITDNGLAPFKDCKKLEYLNVQQSKVTLKLVNEFRKALPECEIDSDFRKKGKK